MNEDKGNIIKLGDVATMLTICSILLYYLGWCYWSAYFATLNIDSSLIDMTIDRLISTTWYFILFVMIGFYMTYYYMLNIDKEKNVNIVLALPSIIYSLLIIFWSSKRINDVLYLSLLSFAIIATIIISKILRKRGISPKSISKRMFVYILTTIIYVASIFYYQDLGQKHANEFKSEYNENVEILLNNSNIFIKGKLIAFMKNKYFVLKKENESVVVCIYNDFDVSQIRMLD